MREAEYQWVLISELAPKSQQVRVDSESCEVKPPTSRPSTITRWFASLNTIECRRRARWFVDSTVVENT